MWRDISEKKQYKFITQMMVIWKQSRSGPVIAAGMELSSFWWKSVMSCTGNRPYDTAQSKHGFWYQVI